MPVQICGHPWLKGPRRLLHKGLLSRAACSVSLLIAVAVTSASGSHTMAVIGQHCSSGWLTLSPHSEWSAVRVPPPHASQSRCVCSSPSRWHTPAKPRQREPDPKDAAWLTVRRGWGEEVPGPRGLLFSGKAAQWRKGLATLTKWLAEGHHFFCKGAHCR